MNDEKNRSSESELDDILGSISASNMGVSGSNGSLLPKRSKPFESLGKSVPQATNVASNPGQGSVSKPITQKPATQQPAKPAAQQPVKPAAQQPVKPAAQQPVKPVVQQPAKPVEQQPVKLAAQQPAKPAAQQPVKPTAQQPVKPAAQQPVKPAVQQPAKPAAQQPVKPATQQPVKPVVQQPVKPVVQQPAKPVEQQPVKPATQQPQTEVPKQVAQQPISDTSDKEMKPTKSEPTGFSHPFINGGEIQPSLEESIRESEKSGKKLVTTDKAAESVAAAAANAKSAQSQIIVPEKVLAQDDQTQTEDTSDKNPDSELLDTGDDLMVLDESEYKTRFRDTAFMGVLRMVIYIAVVIVVSLYISYGIIVAGNDIFAFSKGELHEEKVNIPEGASITEIANLLEDEGIIGSPVTFEYYARFKDFKDKKAQEEENSGAETVEASESTFVTLLNKVLSYAGGFLDYLKSDSEFVYIPGDYLLNNEMSYDKLLDEITHVKKFREIIRITIPEGYTTDEIIELFISKGLEATKEEFVDAINNYDYDYEFVHALEEEGLDDARTYRLDGYLFPDTYEFYNDESAVSVIDKLLTNFDKKFDTSYFDRAAALDMSVDEIINLAALIEKEAKLPAEQLIISSVFHNRITSGNPPKLESCATVQYIYQIVYNERKARILDSDTAIEHPYNTYINRGLPPGPIANPGLNAIIAALYPEDTDFKYFVAKADGSSLFAVNYDEHLKNKKEAEEGYES